MKNYKVVRLLIEAHNQGRTSGEATFAGSSKRIIEERDAARQELSQMFDDVVTEKTRAIEAELEVERLTAEIIQSRNHLHKWQEDVRQETSALAAEIGRLEKENARLHDENTAHSYASAFTVQHLADARLGRLVRAMPAELKLRYCSHGRWQCGLLHADTPEQALLAGGVTDPRQSATPDAETPTDANVERKQANDWQSRGDGVSEMAREAIREADAQRTQSARDRQVVETQDAAAEVFSEIADQIRVERAQDAAVAGATSSVLGSGLAGVTEYNKAQVRAAEEAEAARVADLKARAGDMRYQA